MSVLLAYKGSGNGGRLVAEGLCCLQYRGYNHAGVALLEGDAFNISRSQTAMLDELIQKFDHTPAFAASLAVGFLRWNIEAQPQENSAHPFLSDNLALVANGMLTNYLQLRDFLRQNNIALQTRADTECITRLMQFYMESQGLSLSQAAQKAAAQIEGLFTFIVADCRQPDILVGAQKGLPLILGISQTGFYLTSDVPAFLAHTHKCLYLKEGDLVAIDGNQYQVSNNNQPEQRPIQNTDWDLSAAEKNGHAHYMKKEIFEQVQSSLDTLSNSLKAGSPDIYLPGLNTIAEKLARIKRIIFVACGTSYHAALASRYIFEALVKVPVQVELASELRYTTPLTYKEDLIVTLSQSGETSDTLAALSQARQNGALAITVCNVMDSTLIRTSDGYIRTNAGPEIGIASTKVFTSQLLCLYMLAIYMGGLKKVLDEQQACHLTKELALAPSLIKQTLLQDNNVREIANNFYQTNQFIFLGRGAGYAIALEGALKLKETSYIHAQGYPAGEFLHGPIALVDNNIPIIALTSSDTDLSKSIQAVHNAAGGEANLAIVAQEHDQRAGKLSKQLITVPANHALLAHMLMVIPLQLLAYYIASARGTNVDQPRNLTKSVNIE